MKRTIYGLIFALAWAPTAHAALYMKSHVHGTGPSNRADEAIELWFEGWFEDDRAVINILETNNPTIPQGRIFVEGNTMTLYDPQENTCMPWDLQAMIRFAGQVLESMSGLIDLEFGEPQVEVLERKSGLTLLGRSVDYLKYRSDWTMSLKVPLAKKRTFDNMTVQEVWFDRSLRDELPAAGIFLDPNSFTTGYEQMDKAIAASIPPVDGPALKSYAVSTTTNQKGKVETTTSTSEVTELDRSAADPPGGYTAPADCQVVSMVPPEGAPATAEDQQQGDGGEQPAASDTAKPWSKVKVKNPFGGKKKKDDG